MAVGAYWLMHASVEWFWSYPALTFPMAFALGAAAAPGILSPAGGGPGRFRWVGALVAALVAVAMLPIFLSERYTRQALDSWRADLPAAYEKLAEAADLNPFSDRPPITEAVIAEEAGDPQRALSALAEAQRREPKEWTLYYLEARVLDPIDPAAAGRSLARARELNPRGSEIDELEQELSGP
jgi:cytochrome c-type biogenesis protein CcmH/NrfG